MEVTGRCYCGALRYKAVGEPVFKGQCHCRECQYLTGGSPNVVMGMPVDGFEYTQGEPESFTRSDIDNAVTREFCGQCGTPMTTRAPQMAAAVMLKVGTMDNPAQFGMPQMAIYTCDQQEFHQIPETVPSFDKLPG